MTLLNLTLDQFAQRMENCHLGFIYNKTNLFKYLLGDYTVTGPKRVGIVVSIDFAEVSSGVYRPFLLFKRLETDYKGGVGNVYLHAYSTKYIDFDFVDMVNRQLININIDHISTPILKLDVKSFKDVKDPLNCFHKSLFSIAQLKIIKEYSFNKILFSPTYINYKSSYFYNETIKDVEWFTLKVEGNFEPNSNLTLNRDDGTHLPIIEVGSPCPPMWHDGEKSDT